MLPVDQQMRADAEMGAAWRRCVDAIGYGHMSAVGFHHGKSHDAPVFYAQAHLDVCSNEIDGEGPTPAAALTAVAEALEARK